MKKILEVTDAELFNDLDITILEWKTSKRDIKTKKTLNGIMKKMKKNSNNNAKVELSIEHKEIIVEIDERDKIFKWSIIYRRYIFNRLENINNHKNWTRINKTFWNNKSKTTQINY